MTFDDYIIKGYELFGPDAMKIATQFFSGEIDFATCAAKMVAPTAHYQLNKSISENRPKKIKITSKFSEYLQTLQTPFQEESIEDYDGIVGRFDAIPFEVDDAIESEYYELIYEEN